MGLLINGQWHTDWYDTKATGGRFERKPTSFRNWIEASPEAPYPAESGRYHLYVSLACPWAHRTLIVRKLKGLESMVSVSVVDPLMDDEGWTFSQGEDCVPDTNHHKTFLRELYVLADPNYTGRVTVPVLWDKKTDTIVNNESSDIIRMFNVCFDSLGALEGDFYPESLREEINAINDFVYPNVNNGVYRAGFATTQSAYEEAFDELFSALDTLEARLSTQRYLVGNRLTEADIRLFTTLVRFDPVYFGHFKCNLKQLRDYPNLWNFTKDLYQMPGVASTVNMRHIQEHYYRSHTMINPTGVVPKGPAIDYNEPHDRDRFGKEPSPEGRAALAPVA